MRWYFAACIYLEQNKGRKEYDEYVRLVRPIVEHYGGEYMVRTEAVEALGALWRPDRMIVIRFPDRRSLDTCFGSEEYKGIMCKRISSVDSRAVIVPEFEEGGRIVKISDTVYQLKDEFQITPEISRYVYVYLIEGKKGYYLIDSGVKGCHKKIGDYIHKIGNSRQTINAVLLTHSHPDHMGAAKAIKEQYGGLVYACEGEQNWIENIDVQFRERPIPNFYSLIEGSVAVDKVVRHGDVIALEPGVTLEVINSSGHSKESLSYYYREEGVLFTGDGIPSPEDIPIFENSDNSIETLNRLQKLPGVRVYCPAWDKAYEYQEGQQVIESAGQYMKEISTAVKESLKLHPDSGAETIISMVCDRMKMPQWEREHPLFKRSVLCDIRRLKTS